MADPILPPLPGLGEDPWYGKRTDYDEAVRARLEGDLAPSQLSATIAGSRFRRFNAFGVPLFARGTSYTNGAVDTELGGYVIRTASILGSTEIRNAGAGGSTTGSLPYQYVQDSDDKWEPGTSQGAVIIETGIGEALQEDDATWLGHRRVFERNLLTAIRWHRVAGLRKAGDDTIALDPSGVVAETLTGIGAFDMSPGIKITTTGNGFTITLDETGEGPFEVVLFTVPWRNSANAENGEFSISVDSGPARTSTTLNMGDQRPDGANVILSMQSERITGLSKNSTVRVEKVSGGNVWIYGYGIVRPDAYVPPIALVLDVPLVEVDGEWEFPVDGHAPGPRRNTATLNVYRDIISRVARSAEFSDGGVVIADPGPFWDPATMLDVDGVHPNPTGHEAFARAVSQAFQSIQTA